ncbi:hypothetical protein [Streptomyces sp. UNOC14_S4]|uniref:hypothetical protein n=1 Tax=Streptomyces sp. UNOC14_S4 TaxID=2872340 RepID=UPI001E5E64A4|nr:hypothetical protein [Streptomyces sp. UNOC14_S4]MCC3770240.1 hypothetical protein [Streptomyces sp. UNOC14_S4]
MRLTRAVRVGGAAVLVGATLAGCGVTTTDVIDAGLPATGARRPGGDRKFEVRLYFMSPYGMTSSSREAGDKVGPEDAIALLRLGTNPAEQARGFYSDLPRMNGEIHVTTGTRRVTIQMPYNVLKLSPVARSQLVCTAANAEASPKDQIQSIKVDLSGGSYVVSDLVCEGNNAFPAAAVPSAQPGTPSP